jgi:hypothetical protein
MDCRPWLKNISKGANDKEAALLMEFVLHGLAAYSLISKKVIEGKHRIQGPDGFYAEPWPQLRRRV